MKARASIVEEGVHLRKGGRVDKVLDLFNELVLMDGGGLNTMSKVS